MTVSVADLAAVPILADLGADDLSRLASAATRRRLADGDPLFVAGEDAASVFAVVHGRVVLRASFEGRSTIVMATGAGELLGWIALGEDARWLTTGRASGEVEVILLPADALLELVGTGSPQARRLVRRLFALAAGHLAATQAQLLGRGGEGVITGG
jgi:CRP-like cAMP-binding protein